MLFKKNTDDACRRKTDHKSSHSHTSCSGELRIRHALKGKGQQRDFLSLIILFLLCSFNLKLEYLHRQEGSRA